MAPYSVRDMQIFFIFLSIKDSHQILQEFPVKAEGDKRKLVSSTSCFHSSNNKMIVFSQNGSCRGQMRIVYRETQFNNVKQFEKLVSTTEVILLAALVEIAIYPPLTRCHNIFRYFLRNSLNYFKTTSEISVKTYSPC